jgi:hypothetical protein
MDLLYPSSALGSQGVVVESCRWRVVALQVQEVRDFRDYTAIGATMIATPLKETKGRPL